MKHKLCIKVSKPDGLAEPVVRTRSFSIRRKLLDFLFGPKANVLVLSKGDSVQTVEIREVRKEGEKDGQKLDA